MIKQIGILRSRIAGRTRRESQIENNEAETER
jgi:hypothetical protein